MESDNVNTADTTSIKITSVEKEKIKDPRRVAQGKKLAAISREAKERKARDREAAIREAARRTQLKEEQETNASYASYAIIPIIGIAFGFLYLRNPTKNENRDNTQEGEEPKKKPNLEKP